MEAEDKGVYGTAEELGKKDKALEAGQKPIYGEAEELSKKNVEEIHKFMADPNGRHPKAEKQTAPPSTEPPGVYGSAEELAKKDKDLETDENPIYGEAEKLGKKNAEEMHKFMADPNGRKKP